MKITLKNPTEINVPKGTSLLTDGEFVTLARKRNDGIIELFTCNKEDIFNIDLLDDDEWREFTREELTKALKLK